LVPDFKRIADIGWRKGEEGEFTQSSQRKSTEDTEKNEEKRGEFVTLERKSPPFAKSARMGHPQVPLFEA
jgi:hypothetical protein